MRCGRGRERERGQGGAPLTERLQEDFVQLCVRGEAKRVAELLPRVSSVEAGRGLVAAASRGRRLVVEELLKGRPAVASFVNDQQWNALRAAACSSELAVLDLLVARGPSSPSSRGSPTQTKSAKSCR